MSQSTTRPGRLSDVARHLVLPSGLTSTEFPAIQRRTVAMGTRYDQWQADLVRGTLAKRKNGKYAATVGGIVWSLPRQVGKTFTVGSLLFALAAEKPGMLILWTAHHTRTSNETFRAMQAMARRPQVAPYIENVYTGAGTESVVFKNGSRILFGARDQGFGLGFAAVDVIVFDEAQRLTDQTRMDMVPATNRAGNPAGALLFYIGTPPRPNDKGEAFTSLRNDALSGSADDVFFVELSADPNSDPDDRDQWRNANPSFPDHTPLESMLRMRKHLGSDEAWMREALGVWDQVTTRGAIPFDAWADRLDVNSVAVDSFALGIEVAPDMASASVVMAGRRPDGDWHLEVARSSRGASWVQAYVQQAIDLNPQIRSVIVDVGGPAAAILDQRNDRWMLGEVRVTAMKVANLGVACMSLKDGATSGWVWHLGDPFLDSAVQTAGKRDLADTGRWVFSRKSTTSDITPIQAAALALWGSQNDDVKRPAAPADDDGEVVVF